MFTHWNSRRSPTILRIIVSILSGIAFLIGVNLFALMLRRKSSPLPIKTTFNTNLLHNGDAETGPCETDEGVTNPTGWNFNGSVSQVSYDNECCGTLANESPGPKNRGNCYFYGLKSKSPSMWQTIDLSQNVSESIDRGIVKFHLSAWLGGWAKQNDNAQVSIAFFNQTKHQMRSRPKIGPVFAADRNKTTSLIFRQINGSVPIGTRSAEILVKFIRSDQKWNGASVDNISFELFL